MALAYNPFSEDGRQRRLTDPQPYSSYPAGANVNPGAVGQANPNPQTVPVESLPNQLNVDEGAAYPINEAFLEWSRQRQQAGTGFLPVPTPYMTYQQERDPVTGDYISRGYEADWSGVPGAVQNLQQLYMEPIVGRANRSIQDENAQRERVRQVAQPQYYDTERSVQNIDPITGRSYTTFVPQQGIKPFFPIESLFL